MIRYHDTKSEAKAVDHQALLTRREQVADEITQTIGKLGVLCREEVELRDQLRRAAEADGSRANAFSTASSVMDVINSELTRAGLTPRRADPRVRLADLIADQNRRYRNQMTVRHLSRGQSAA
jgi:hypothetical protein